MSIMLAIEITDTAKRVAADERFQNIGPKPPFREDIFELWVSRAGVFGAAYEIGPEPDAKDAEQEGGKKLAYTTHGSGSRHRALSHAVKLVGDGGRIAVVIPQKGNVSHYNGLFGSAWSS